MNIETSTSINRLIRENAYLATENIKLKKIRYVLLAALIECDEAMDYISERNIPIALPERVKEAILQAKGD